MHKGYCIDHVQKRPRPPANVFSRQLGMVVRIGVGDAAAAWRNSVEAALIHGLKEGCYGARPRDLLRIDQLL